MSVVPIKFRCFRCEQLLGVKPSKVGSVVSCPKCAAELIVPEPLDSTNHEPESKPAFSSVPTSESNSAKPNDAGISLDLIDIRPEDIRVEPGYPSPIPKPVDVLVELDAPRTYSAPPPEPTRPAAEPTLVIEIPPSPALPSPLPISIPEMEIAPIRVNSSKLSSSRTPQKPLRASDLVIPRSVVSAWSMLVLFAVAFAFAAGLLAGHFVWKVH